MAVEDVLDDVELVPVIPCSREALDNMLEHVAKSTAVFKSQQIDDPDISEEDKRKIAEAVLFENPVTFLNRFGCFLNQEHLELLLSFRNDENKYDVDFHIKRLSTTLDSASKKLSVRNRRFEALRRLQENGSYFSESEMEEREPLLYHQLVGQYLSDREKYLKHREDLSAVPSFSGFLIKQAENDALQELRIKQEEEEAVDQSNSSDEEMPESVENNQRQRWGEDWDDFECNKKKKQKNDARKNKIAISDEEKRLLLQEFRTHLFTKFMDGLDAEFDYSSIDGNPEYDCLQLRSQDEEEKYFDDETCGNSLCTDTGIEDY